MKFDTKPKPKLVVEKSDPRSTAVALCDLFAQSGLFYERTGPVCVLERDGRLVAHPLTWQRVVYETHGLCEPVTYVATDHGVQEVPIKLPRDIAEIYLNLVGEWNLPRLDGITTSPILRADGSIGLVQGYDLESRLYVHRLPTIIIPEEPTKTEATAALEKLRAAFKTFPFDDATRVREDKLDVVDVTKPPGLDESAFLAGLLTAICRASLWLAPGLLLTAPEISGAGSGKGLLARAISIIAFGSRPHAMPRGRQREELDKRIVAELRTAVPMLFVDNVNGTSLRSETLSAVLTERPARARVLGKSENFDLNSTAFIALTGNGLSVSEDLARRFLSCRLDAKVENPEARPFAPGFLEGIEENRRALLEYALTIWRWGRHNTTTIKRGRSVGNYEVWAEWVRDPLHSLGCRDPAERADEIKAADPIRRQAAELLNAWYAQHGNEWLTLTDIHDAVFTAAGFDEKGKTPTVQARRRIIEKRLGTRVSDLVLEIRKGMAKRAPAQYRIVSTETTASPASKKPVFKIVPKRKAAA